MAIKDQGFRSEERSDGAKPDEQLEDGGRLQRPRDRLRLSRSKESFTIVVEFTASGTGKVMARANNDIGRLLLGVGAFITATLLWALTDKPLPSICLMAGTILLTWMHSFRRPAAITRPPDPTGDRHR